MAWEYAAGHALYHLLVFLLLSSHAVSLIWNITHKFISYCEKRDAYIMCRVVSTFAALIFTTGRVTTEWGMSPTDPKISAGSTLVVRCCSLISGRPGNYP